MVEVGYGCPVMAHDVVALPAHRGGSVHDVLAGSVVVIRVLLAHRGMVVLSQVNEVEIGSSEALHPTAQVASDGEGLEEDLGAYHCRAEVEENTTLHIGHRRTVDFEILATGPAQGGEVALRVLVDDVGAQGDVDSDRHAQ